MEQDEHRTIHIHGEVIEEYRRAFPREVVETYAHPQPPVPAEAPKPRKKAASRWRNLRIFLEILAVIALILVVQRVFFPGFSQQDYYADDWQYDDGLKTEHREITMPTYPVGEGAALTLAAADGGVLTPQEVYQQVNPAAVTVISQVGSEMAVGTGVIFRPDGYIITNYHVVEGSAACVVALDSGYTYDAAYVAGDMNADLAVLKIDGTALPTANFGDSDLLTVGDPVYAIGNPLGVELRGTMTDGIVSAINRDVFVENRTMTLIQTNAALNFGNSGGPLINQYGQVVGINVIKMASSYSSVEGLGFAIPTASMQRIVNDLLTYGEVLPEPVLGVTVIQVAERLDETLWGIKVDSVTAGSAADEAGVREGDYIIAADGAEVISSQALLRARRQHHVGDDMTLTLWRDGETLEVTLHLTDSGAIS